MNSFKSAFLLLPLLASCAVSATGLRMMSSDLSPLSFGLMEAKTGIERYNIILETHKTAIKYGVNVNYNGVKTINIEIPEKADRIPLTKYNDFCGCEFIVSNSQKPVYLFESLHQSKSIEISKADIDKGDFRNNPIISKGQYLLLIQDDSPWVDNRRGYNYGHIRKDILFVKNGIAQNKVVMPYNNLQSNPVCHCIKEDGSPLIIKNLTIRRAKNSKEKTYVFFITGKNDVRLINFSLYTPENDKIYDRAIRIDDCTNVNFENILIDGTYSQKDRSGYGINFDNVWNFSAKNLVGRANWGIFGTNNVNTVHIENSDINRFDIHCYGKDIFFYNTVFRNLYNQFSSLYGTLSFENCSFYNFVPVLFEASYSAYTYFKLIIKDCFVEVDKERPYLIRAGNPSLLSKNERKELEKPAWPDVEISNMSVQLPVGQKEWTLFYVGGKDTPIMNGIKQVNISGVKIISGSSRPPEIMFSNRKMNAKQKLNISVRESNVDKIKY